MLTPVDIQQKKFHSGIGYDKKDVNTFFESVAESYEQLYRSNAELKEKVISLTDGLQNYKSKEEALQKSLMLAEKDSEDTKSKANREAKTIELDAKNKAKIILADAETRLEEIKTEIKQLETQYAMYKSNFASLLKMQFGFLKENDFDVDSYIDPNFAGIFASGAAPRPKDSSAFGEFSSDPQMRDESPLGGAGGYTGMNSMNSDNMTSSSAMYGSSLSVDPFNPNSKPQPGRYNPYDGSNNTNKSSKASGTGSTTFTFAEDKQKQKAKKTSYRPTADGTNASKQQAQTQQSNKPKPTTKATQDAKEKAANKANATAKPTSQTAEKAKANTVKPEVKKQAAPKHEAPKTKVDVKPSNTDDKTVHDYEFDKEVDDIIAKIKREVEEQHLQETSSEETATVKEAESSTAEASQEQAEQEEQLVGDVEEKKSGVAMISDGEEISEDADDDGFEFI